MEYYRYRDIQDAAYRIDGRVRKILENLNDNDLAVLTLYLRPYLVSAMPIRKEYLIEELCDALFPNITALTKDRDNGGMFLELADVIMNKEI